MSTLFLILIGGQACDIAFKREDWPFSNYPMYSGVRRDILHREEIVGVTEKGEIVLKPSKHFSPLDNTRFQRVLSKIRRKRRDAEYQEALSQLFQRYEELRLSGAHTDPPLLAVRAYQLTWKLMSGASNKKKPDQRALRLYVHRPPQAVMDRLEREANDAATVGDQAARHTVRRGDIVIDATDMVLTGNARLVVDKFASSRRALVINERAKHAPNPTAAGSAEIEIARARGTYEVWLRGSTRGKAKTDSIWLEVTSGGTLDCMAPQIGMGNWTEAFPSRSYAWSSAAPGAPTCTLKVTGLPVKLRITGREGRVQLDQLWLTRKPIYAPDFAEPVVLEERDASRQQAKP